MSALESTSSYERTRAELADQLRHFRRERGLTGLEVASLISDIGGSLSQSKLSKIENLKLTASVADVEMLVQLYQPPADVASRLLDMARDLANESTSWSALHRSGTAAHQDEIFQAELRASSIFVFQLSIIPGLLQTAAYMREVFIRLSYNRRDLDAAVAKRLERQQLLDLDYRHFDFIIDEAVLRSPMLDSAQMTVQLDRIMAISKRPNVSIGLLRRDKPGVPILFNSFVLLDDKSVITETLTHEVVLRSPQEVGSYREVAAAVTESAEFGEPFLHRISRIRKCYQLQLDRDLRSQQISS